MNDEERLKQGFSVRRAVLGDAHVDRAEASKTELNAEFQNFITRYAWGEIWARPNLSRHTRSLITISMLIALNRADELKMHLSAAFNNGVTEDEIKEVIMHSTAVFQPLTAPSISPPRCLHHAGVPRNKQKNLSNSSPHPSARFL
jgi:4-carboxymuconolactone decarboxylase